MKEGRLSDREHVFHTRHLPERGSNIAENQGFTYTPLRKKAQGKYGNMLIMRRFAATGLFDIAVECETPSTNYIPMGNERPAEALATNLEGRP